LNGEQKENKIKNLLARLKRKGKIELVGRTKAGVWQLKTP